MSPRRLFTMALTPLILTFGGCHSTDPGPSGGETSAPAPAEGASTGAPVPRSEPPPFYLGGIQVNEAEPQAWFDALKREGMNSVQVTDYARHGEWDSDDLRWEEVPWVVEEIRGAKRNGLNVVFVARVALDSEAERNAFLWHGMILPKTDALLDSWFEKYGRFVVRWAEVAEREGVDVLMLGSEMNALASTLPAQRLPALEEYFLNEEKQQQRRREVLAHRDLVDEHELLRGEQGDFDSVEGYLDARIAIERGWAETVAGGEREGVDAINARRARLQEHWLELIAKVRKVYGGKIGYAANFDQYHLVGFWDALDVMGINAYFKLRNRLVEGGDGFEDRLYPLLREGWGGVLSKIQGFRELRGLDLPVIFTEMGYTFRAESTLEPWAHTGFSLIQGPTRNSDGSDSPAEERLVVWEEQPDRLEERALAVRALYEAHRDLNTPFLRGILYWKLSSHEYHKEHEAFMVHIGASTGDPVLPELRRFLGD
ncbi:MAG: hypothetical protein AAGN66_20010 [Acidobacteriota bacterium]